jgi:glyoxylase-like metal-dependent hydrolase (beta-lactamase superfamily II)
VKVHAEPKPLVEPLPGGSTGAQVVVEPLRVGELQCPPAMFESTGGRLADLRYLGVGTPRSRWWWVPCPAFLIHHPNAGPLLVDTGLHPSVAAHPSANLGRLVTSFAKPRMGPGEDLPAQLRSRGLEPKDIGTVVMTHLHFDHTSGMSEFPHSTFIVTDTEWEAATTDMRPFLRGYRPSHFDYVFDYRTLSYEGDSVSSYSTFGRTFDLFGDGSVRLAFTPGHSAGHQSVICRLAERDFVIAGDAIYTIGQLADAPEPPRPLDRHTWQRSLQELKLFHSQYPQAVIVPGHDPEHWQTLEVRYE